MKDHQLKVSDVAKIVGCHRNTVLRYDQKGVIHSMRDNNNFRRYSIGEALKLKEIMSFREGINE